MIRYEDARKIVIAHARPLPEETVVLAASRERVLAQDVLAVDDVPPFDNSAMDGYALLAADTTDATADAPVTLRCIGETAAGGTATETVTHGTCVSIMTGAMMPQGADAVIPVENTRKHGDSVFIERPVEVDANVRHRGEDIAAGTVALAVGTVLGPPEIGVLASVGRPGVAVHRRPRVAVISTGSELIDGGVTLTPGAIRDSNTHLLRALVEEAGAEVERAGFVVDEPGVLRGALADALDAADLVITTGGVSMGEYDFVKEVLESLGAERRFWGVAQKPGKPLAFYTIDDTAIFGLPGNPAAVHITFLEYVRPYLHRLAGHRSVDPLSLRVPLAHDVRKKPGRLGFLRVRLTTKDGETSATAAGVQGSGVLSTSARANAIALLPQEAGDIAVGEMVVVHVFDVGGFNGD